MPYNSFRDFMERLGREGRLVRVGEPPSMLAISVLHAISDAVASVADHKICPRLDAPATPERVLTTIERLRTQSTGDRDARGP